MHAFDYVKPASLAEAVAAHAATHESRYLAGGMTLLPTLKMRLARPERLVDLGGLPALSGIRAARDHVEIGAMTRHADVADSPDLRRAIPALAALAAGIGDALVRNRGTLGGSVANNDPAADYPAALVALGATVITDRREIDVDAFFTGLFSTSLAPGELIVRVRFPIARRGGYAKFPNPASRYAMAGVFVAETERGIRVAVTGAGPGVFRLAAHEAALANRFAVEAIDRLEVDADGLNEDLHGSAAYRAQLAQVMARRAVAAATA
jgi:carbon-monoxide dehydrogenase medium subunit